MKAAQGKLNVSGRKAVCDIRDLNILPGLKLAFGSRKWDEQEPVNVSQTCLHQAAKPSTMPTERWRTLDS
ncbi:MAG TPA: hypothetical protein VF182_01495 [Candidatus Binatia bacterium]